MRLLARFRGFVPVLLLAACASEGALRVEDEPAHQESAASDAPFAWRLPRGFPKPPVPADNPMSVAKVALGRRLFYDPRLSGNQTFSCATCHKQERAFADEHPVGVGATGELHTRGAMSLANIAYNPTLTWGNPQVTSLERQAEVPLFGTHPVELGMQSAEEVEARLRDEPLYEPLFRAAFPGDPSPVVMVNVTRAIAAFERTLISGTAPYDQWLAGDAEALSASAQRGFFLFNSEKLECFHCHQGVNFTDHFVFEGQAFRRAPPFHSTGLYDVDGAGSYPAPNTGVHSVSNRLEDMGMFKAPTLRNIALTAPYMHDGSLKTLSDVLDHYAAGGRARSARTDPLMIGFALTGEERADVIAFLESLTDRAFVTDPAFADPWARD
ncbi:MAG: MbnH family di-heme enzyme [Polyangiales bacterium]